MKFKIHIGFILFLIMVFGYANYEALTSFSRGAQLFPLMLAVPGLVLCLVLLWKEISARSNLEKNADRWGVDSVEDSSTSLGETLRGAGEILIWMLGLYLAIWIVGFKIAVIGFFILYLRKKGNVRWRTTLILTAIAGYAIFIHFENLMSIFWPPCILSKWIHAPWLLGS